jgi:protein TonB
MKRIYFIFFILFVCTSSFANVINDDELLLIQYGKLLTENFSKDKYYPRIASIRGWEGTVTIQLLVDSNGNYMNSRVYESSGYELLDKTAIEIVRKSSPYPRPPKFDGLKQINVIIPIVFQKLSNIEKQ